MRSVKWKSAGAVNTGLPPRMTSASTAPLFHVVGQLLQRSGMIHRPGRDGSGMDHGFTDVAEALVDGVGQQMDDSRLPVAGKDDAALAAAVEIAGDRRHPFLMRPGGSFSGGGDAKLGRDRPGNSFDRMGLHRQSVVGLGPGIAQGRLDGVQAVHARLLRGRLTGPHAPPAHEVGDVAEAAGPQPRKSASSERTTSAFLKSQRVWTGSP